ncbi:hypothetical protein [Corallibacter sp.]|uniref:hypothetical protein n=1 Tax=Corallibacter sp. TaxID=2038084 RepID=UPI003A93D0E4
MKTQEKQIALLFNKTSIAELSNKEQLNVQGGTSTFTIVVETIIRTKTYGTWIDHGPL